MQALALLASLVLLSWQVKTAVIELEGSEYHPRRWLAAQSEGSQEPGHGRSSDASDPLHQARLWTRGNSVYGGADGDYIDDAGIGIKVASLKAKGVPQGTQGTQMLLLKQADWEAPINPYVAPRDLVVFWGDSTSYGTIASSFQGGRGRSASGERVRRVLNFGTFTGNGYMDDASGHGRFLRTWTGLQFESMSLRCCKSLLVPPMERDLPIASEQDQLSRKIRSFVANGNQLILTGGDYSSLVFLNRFFHYNLRKTVYDQGPFEKMPAKSMPENAIKDFAALPETLPQLGYSAYLLYCYKSTTTDAAGGAQAVCDDYH